jgi:hypothetical protein
MALRPFGASAQAFAKTAAGGVMSARSNARDDKQTKKGPANGRALSFGLDQIDQHLATTGAGAPNAQDTPTRTVCCVSGACVTKEEMSPG